MDRRAFVAAAGVAAVALATPAAQAKESVSPKAGLYRDLVPEIFAPLPDPPQHTEAIVVGSGFGAAMTTLRLAQAGVEVSVLERGSRWPNDPWRDIFVGDMLPDGRGLWHRTSFTGGTQIPVPVDPFGGVLCVDDFRHLSVWRAAAVGGGSVCFGGVMIAPEQHLFDAVFRGVVDYRELRDVYYPRVRKMLRVSPMPDDVYHSAAFAHARAWDDQARRAGYQLQRPDLLWNWAVVRDELAGRCKASATVGYSNFGNSNGAKFDLNQNYLRYAQGTGKARIYPGHRVDAIAAERDGRYSVRFTTLAPTGETLRTCTVTCDRLFLGAGSIGTSELLMRARATGTLPNLNEHVGQEWGTNGDVVLARTLSSLDIGLQGAPCATRILDERGGAPTTLENWYVAGGTPTDVGLLASMGMVLDDTRGRLVYNRSTDGVVVDWPRDGSRAAVLRASEVNRNAINGSLSVVPPVFGANGSFTAHPLGGAVLGKATDGHGRVHGHKGLYVMDGAAVPGSTGTVNPSLTISALAERNIEHILRARG